MSFSVPMRRTFANLWTAVVIFGVSAATDVKAQGGTPSASGVATYERTYPQSKAAVEKALKELQLGLSGRLPVLDGFAAPGTHPLNRYQRPYYQSSVHVSSTPSGGSIVRVNTKLTAWYADPVPANSGYQLLMSNGRLETDLLDQLSELFANGSNSKNVNADSNPGSSLEFPSNASSHDPTGASAVQQDKKSNRKTAVSKPDPEPAISAPTPSSDSGERTFSSSASVPAGLPSGLSSEQVAPKGAQNKPVPQSSASLQAEAESLEEILKNQAHPKNLVAVKKSGTPVVSTPSLNGKTLFLASAQDEFEMLDFNSDWVHVRISGLSRGWIWRTSLEMPEGISDVPKAASTGAPTIADLFQVSREEKAPFPGDWEPLRGKKVKIISVQKIHENEKDSDAQAKLEYAKSLLDKNYAELAAESRDLAGIVLIFDSVDGGMIAATISTVQAWKAGTLSDAALWHQCYFDPPETFIVSSNPASGH